MSRQAPRERGTFFERDVKITGSGKGIIFPDGSKLTTASDSGGGGSVTGETSVQEGRAVSGKATGMSGIAVYGEANYDATMLPPMAKQNYGGYFVADGPPMMMGSASRRTGVGVYATGNLWAADFDGDVRIEGDVAIRGGELRISSAETGQTIIELGEGLDYAEGFDLSNATDIAPGTVLVIDAEHAGQLKTSETSYDRKVAGIAAGAKGLGSGVRLGGGRFDCNVALAGRVYCNVETSAAGVEPGDLLTTSTEPGYAMKVVDHARAQGATLGKAMEPLERGKKGQILVLVTLQ